LFRLVDHVDEDSMVHMHEWLGRKQAKKNHIILWERILSRIVRDNYRTGGQLGSNKNRESDLPGYNSIASRPHQKPAPRKTKLVDAVRWGGVHEIEGVMRSIEGVICTRIYSEDAYI
jgi:hypothetical protein